MFSNTHILSSVHRIAFKMMITYIIIKIHSKHRIQIQYLQGVFKARTRRAQCALQDPTAFPQRPHSALSNTLCKRQAAAFDLNMLSMAF